LHKISQLFQTKSSKVLLYTCYSVALFTIAILIYDAFIYMSLTPMHMTRISVKHISLRIFEIKYDDLQLVGLTYLIPNDALTNMGDIYVKYLPLSRIIITIIDTKGEIIYTINKFVIPLIIVFSCLLAYIIYKQKLHN